MRPFATCAAFLLGVGAAAAQVPPDNGSTAPLTSNQNDMRDAAAAAQIALLTRQNALLSQILAQYQRGLVTYPIAMPLPGPINCRGDCRAAVAAICGSVKYPNSTFYPATVPADTIGVYVNGVCYGP